MDFLMFYASMAGGVAYFTHGRLSKTFAHPRRFHHKVGIFIASITLGSMWPVSAFKLVCRSIARASFKD